MKIEYPKWIYSAAGARLVKSPKEHAAYPGWSETPVVAAAEPTPEQATADMAVPVAKEEPAQPVPDDSSSPLDAFYAARAADVVERVLQQEDPEQLRALRSLEENRPGGSRRRVLRAVADRLSQLVSA